MRLDALQKDIALLKSLAIDLRNVDLQPLRPFGLRVVDASVMPDLVGSKHQRAGESCGPSSFAERRWPQSTLMRSAQTIHILKHHFKDGR